MEFELASPPDENPPPVPPRHSVGDRARAAGPDAGAYHGLLQRSDHAANLLPNRGGRGVHPAARGYRRQYRNVADRGRHRHQSGSECHMGVSARNGSNLLQYGRVWDLLQTLFLGRNDRPGGLALSQPRISRPPPGTAPQVSDSIPISTRRSLYRIRPALSRFRPPMAPRQRPVLTQPCIQL